MSRIPFRPCSHLTHSHKHAHTYIYIYTHAHTHIHAFTTKWELFFKTSAFVVLFNGRNVTRSSFCSGKIYCAFNRFCCTAIICDEIKFVCFLFYIKMHGIKTRGSFYIRARKQWYRTLFYNSSNCPSPSFSTNVWIYLKVEDYFLIF